MPRQKGFTVHQVLAMLEDDNEFTRADIFITPPCDTNCSDEDSDIWFSFLWKLSCKTERIYCPPSSSSAIRWRFHTCR